jgi:NACalpha-BTF3-like transcription factor
MRDLNRPVLSPTAVPAPTASEEDIVMLESMGFPRDRVIEALQATRNNVQAAVAHLLHNER